MTPAQLGVLVGYWQTLSQAITRHELLNATHPRNRPSIAGPAEELIRQLPLLQFLPVICDLIERRIPDAGPPDTLPIWFRPTIAFLRTCGDEPPTAKFPPFPWPARRPNGESTPPDVLHDALEHVWRVIEHQHAPRTRARAGVRCIERLTWMDGIERSSDGHFGARAPVWAEFGSALHERIVGGGR